MSNHVDNTEKVIQLDADMHETIPDKELELTEDEKKYWEQLLNDPEASIFFYRPGQTTLTVRLQKEVIKAMRYLDEQEIGRKK